MNPEDNMYDGLKDNAKTSANMIKGSKNAATNLKNKAAAKSAAKKDPTNINKPTTSTPKAPNIKQAGKNLAEGAASTNPNIQKAIQAKNDVKSVAAAGGKLATGNVAGAATEVVKNPMIFIKVIGGIMGFLMLIGFFIVVMPMLLVANTVMKVVEFFAKAEIFETKGSSKDIYENFTMGDQYAAVAAAFKEGLEKTYEDIQTDIDNQISSYNSSFEKNRWGLALTNASVKIDNDTLEAIDNGTVLFENGLICIGGYEGEIKDYKGTISNGTWADNTSNTNPNYNRGLKDVDGTYTPGNAAYFNMLETKSAVELRVNYQALSDLAYVIAGYNTARYDQQIFEGTILSGTALAYKIDIATSVFGYESTSAYNGLRNLEFINAFKSAMKSVLGNDTLYSYTIGSNEEIATEKTRKVAEYSEKLYLATSTIVSQTYSYDIQYTISKNSNTSESTTNKLGKSSFNSLSSYQNASNSLNNTDVNGIKTKYINQGYTNVKVSASLKTTKTGDITYKSGKVFKTMSNVATEKKVTYTISYTKTETVTENKLYPMDFRNAYTYSTKPTIPSKDYYTQQAIKYVKNAHPDGKNFTCIKTEIINVVYGNLNRSKYMEKEISYTEINLDFDVNPVNSDEILKCIFETSSYPVITYGTNPEDYTITFHSWADMSTYYNNNGYYTDRGEYITPEQCDFGTYQRKIAFQDPTEVGYWKFYYDFSSTDGNGDYIKVDNGLGIEDQPYYGVTTYYKYYSDCMITNENEDGEFFYDEITTVCPYCGQPVEPERFKTDFGGDDEDGRYSSFTFAAISAGAKTTTNGLEIDNATGKIIGETTANGTVLSYHVITVMDRILETKQGILEAIEGADDLQAAFATTGFAENQSVQTMLDQYIKLVSKYITGSENNYSYFKNGNTYSAGLFGWSGNDLKSLLIKIKNADESNYNFIVGTSGFDLNVDWSNFGSDDHPTYAPIIQSLLSSSVGQTIQASVAKTDAAAEVKLWIDYGATSSEAIVLLGYMSHDLGYSFSTATNGSLATLRKLIIKDIQDSKGATALDSVIIACREANLSIGVPSEVQLNKYVTMANEIKLANINSIYSVGSSTGLEAATRAQYWVSLCTKTFNQNGYDPSSGNLVWYAPITTQTQNDAISKLGYSPARQSLYDTSGNPISGFRYTDCSGLVSEIYKSLGYTGFGTTAKTIQNNTSIETVVPISELAVPGDILCYSHSHVTIYIGNGQEAEASSWKSGLKIDNVVWSEVSTIKRVISVTDTN